MRGVGVDDQLSRDAELAQGRVPLLGLTERVPNASCAVLGTRVPVLRETKMPAVLCRVGPPEVAVALRGVPGTVLRFRETYRLPFAARPSATAAAYG